MFPFKITGKNPYNPKKKKKEKTEPPTTAPKIEDISSVPQYNTSSTQL